jgi:purine-binding chemotaxis protein CheW
MTEAATASARELLVVRLGPSRFGLWVDEVLEIVRTPPISRLPLASDEVPGVTSIRGDVIPILDLGVRLMGRPAERPGRLVLVRHHGSGSLVGLLVDAADTLASVTDEEVRPAPAAAEARMPTDLIVGVVALDEGVVTVLDLARAAAPPTPPETGEESDDELVP